MPDKFRNIPTSDLDVSVEDLAELCAAFARDRVTGTRSTRDFNDAVAMHRLIDAIVDFYPKALPANLEDTLTSITSAHSTAVCL